jgi:hypothetical protein
MVEGVIQSHPTSPTRVIGVLVTGTLAAAVFYVFLRMMGPSS